MIDRFYREFKIRDYIGDEKHLKSKNIIDCSLGTNPFIRKGYTDQSYSKLKSKIIEVVKQDMNVIISRDNISFGAWHDGNSKKRMRVYN